MLFLEKSVEQVADFAAARGRFPNQDETSELDWNSGLLAARCHTRRSGWGNMMEIRSVIHQFFDVLLSEEGAHYHSAESYPIWLG
jgi:hypothetical protein